VLRRRKPSGGIAVVASKSAVADQPDDDLLARAGPGGRIASEGDHAPASVWGQQWIWIQTSTSF
jgi:hypothetical protein